MLALLLLYFVWKHYSDLAKTFEKKGWPYGLLGVVVYYGGTILFGVIIVIISEYNPDLLPELSDISLSLITIPFGLICTTLLYKFLKKRWLANSVNNDDSIIDAELIENQEL